MLCTGELMIYKVDRSLLRGAYRRVVRVKSTIQDAVVELQRRPRLPRNLWLPDRILISHGARVVFLLVWLKLV